MADKDITNSSVGDVGSYYDEFTIAHSYTDGADESGDTTYINHHWPKYLGYYRKIPELAAAIDAKATWTVGKGFRSNPLTEMALSRITGWGKDTFNTILENAVRTYYLAGDFFAEIIRNKEGYLINLKPLDPGTIHIVANKQGRIKRYVQWEKTGKENKKVATFTPDKIFHLARNRIADEIHGQSIIPAVEDIILARAEAIRDYRKLLGRNVNPIKVWSIDTDDATEIANFKAKVDQAYGEVENIIVPRGTVEPPQIIGVPPNSTLNPLPWIQQLNQYFFQAVGVPMLIVGGSQELTEASAKIAYLAFEQIIEEEQLFLEEQILAQLNLEIELDFPATLQNEMLSSRQKEESTRAATPEDTAVTNMGVSPNA